MGTWGLAVSIYVLWIAKGAKTAAKAATHEAEGAAEVARSASRSRSALEDLQGAAAKTTQIGLFAHAGKWDLVGFTAEEVMNTCRATVARWGDEPILKDSRNRLLLVANLMQTIAKEANSTTTNLQRILDAQLAASDKLSFVLGKARRGQDLGSI